MGGRRNAPGKSARTTSKPRPGPAHRTGVASLPCATGSRGYAARRRQARRMREMRAPQSPVPATGNERDQPRAVRQIRPGQAVRARGSGLRCDLCLSTPIPVGSPRPLPGRCPDPGQRLAWPAEETSVNDGRKYDRTETEWAELETAGWEFLISRARQPGPITTCAAGNYALWHALT
jgi:hypothetical protein